MNPDPQTTFRKVADRIRARIVDGTLVSGEHLPSIREFCEEYATSPATIRQALGLLRSEGLIDSAQGVGYFVRKPVAMMQVRSGESHFVKEAKAQGHEAEIRVMDVSSPHDPPDQIAARLELPEGERAIRRRLVLFLDGVPVQLAELWFPHALVKDTRISEHAKLSGGARGELRAVHGIGSHHLSDDITSRMPTPQEVQALHLPPGTPVIRILRTSYGVGGVLGEDPRPIQVIEYTLAADRLVLTYEAPYRDHR